MGQAPVADGGFRISPQCLRRLSKPQVRRLLPWNGGSEAARFCLSGHMMPYSTLRTSVGCRLRLPSRQLFWPAVMDRRMTAGRRLRRHAWPSSPFHRAGCAGDGAGRNRRRPRPMDECTRARRPARQGLAQHPMLYVGENYTKMFLVNDGKVIWTYPTGTGLRI